MKSYFHLRRWSRPALLLATLLRVPTAFGSDPSLSLLPDLAFDEDSGPHDVPLVLNVDGINGAAFTVTATSDNPALLPPDGLLVTGSGTQWTLSLMTSPDAWGQALITVAAIATNHQPAIRLEQQFHLIIRPVEDLLSIEPIPNLVVTEGTPLIKVPIHLHDPEHRSGIALSARAQGAAVGMLQLSVTGAGAKWVLRVSSEPTVATGNSPRSMITVTASAGTLSVSTSFLVIVVPREFEPANDWSPSLGGGRDPSFRWFWPGQPIFPQILDLTLSQWSRFRGDNSGSKFPYLPGAWTDVAIGDVNGTGRPAALLYSRELNTLVSWRRGRYEAGPVTNALEQLEWESAAFADLDGNGTQDLVYTGAVLAGQKDRARVAIAWNDGTGVFTPAVHNLPGFAGPVVPADFDNDGRIDLLLCPGTNLVTKSPAQVFLNAGGGSFIPAGTVGLTQDVTAAGVVDVDGDGVWDVWLVHRVIGGRDGLQLDVFRQVGGVFVPYYTLPASEFSGMAAPAWGDFDNDGRVDFVASYHSPSADSSLKNYYAAAYYNDGHGSFRRGGFVFPLPDAPITRPSFIPVAADADLDGNLDIIGIEGQRWLPFLNARREPNQPPNTPTGLHSVLVGSQVYLFWSGAGDGNQTTPLTYNVRVGTAPGTNDVVPSLSVANGTRQIAAPGNAGFLNYYSFSLPRLDLNMLYWTVQAVDASFVGGLFAPEQQLAVALPGNQPPVLSTPPQIVADEDTEVEVPVVVSDDRSPDGALTWRAWVDDPQFFKVPPSLSGGRLHASPATNWITLLPTFNTNGLTMLHVAVADANGAATTNSVQIVIQPVNDSPTIDISAPMNGPYYRGDEIRVRVHLDDLETPARQLTLQAATSDPQLLPLDNIAFFGSSANRELVVHPRPDAFGAVTVTVTVTDGDGATGTADTQLIWEDQMLQPTPLEDTVAALVERHWIDMDGDGRLDIVGITGTGGIQVFRQGENGAFVLLSTYQPVAPPGMLAVRLLPVDLDGDGDVDLVVEGRSTTTPAAGWCLLLHNQQGQLADQQLLLEAAPFAALEVTDLDGNGQPDLVRVDADLSLHVWKNQGGRGTWTTLSVTSATGILDPERTTPAAGLLPADVNGDGRMDLIVIRRGPGLPTWSDVLYQDDQGGFSDDGRPPWPPTWEPLLWADFDNDSQPDMLLRTAEPAQVPFELATQGTLGIFKFRTAPVESWTGEVADFSGDGFEDVLCNYDHQTALVSQLGGDHPVIHPQHPLAPTSTQVSAGDFNRDGRLDLLTGWGSGGLTQLLQNAGAPSNSPPAVPDNPQAHGFANGAFELAWSASSDAEQAGGLTYNLRLGTTPGANDVVPSMALPDGAALLPVRGNMGWKTRVNLRGLDFGRRYYWSVQAVDSGLARSAFAPEASFRATFAPIISAQADTLTLPEGTNVATLVFSIEDAGTPAGQLHLTTQSLNPVLLPGDGVTIEGTGVSRTLRFELVPYWNGRADVVLRAGNADGLIAERTIHVLANPLSRYVVEYRHSVEVTDDGRADVALDAFDNRQEFGHYVITVPPVHGYLVGMPPNVTYQPVAGFLGTDQFQYYAFRADNGLALGVITLNVVPAYRVRPELRLATFGTPERLKLVLRARAASKVRLEHSRDLHSWEPLWEEVVPAGEAILLDPPDLGGAVTRFYRVVQDD